MAKIVLEEGKEFALLPVDSIVNLKIAEVVIRDVDGARGKWEKLEITFEILSVQATGDGSPVGAYDAAIGSKIWGSVPFKLTDSAENKLRMWTEAILGMELGLGFELDTDYFVGRTVRGLTTQYEKRAKDSQGNPFKSHQIGSLLPAATTQQAPQAPNYAAAPTPAAAPAQQGYAFGQQPVTQPMAQVSGGSNGVGWQAEEPPF